MLDIKFVRENPDAIDIAMGNRQTTWDRARFFELDGERRSVIAEVEELQATRNAESKKIGALMREGKRGEAEAAKEAVREVNERIEGLAERRGALEAELDDFMAHLPNIPVEATPVGVDVRGQAALGSRHRSRHPRFRPRQQAVRQPFHRARRCRRPS